MPLPLISYVFPDNLKENYVLETVDNLLKNHGSQLSRNVIAIAIKEFTTLHKSMLKS